MLKFVETDITFVEIPNEVSLCINISNCPCKCRGCHSPHLAKDIGTPLTAYSLEILLRKYASDVTTVCFMGGDSDPQAINTLAQHIRHHYPALKVAWYSGKNEPSFWINPKNFDYIKLGSYKHNLGPLTSKTTNQRLYRLHQGRYKNITSLFWK